MKKLGWRGRPFGAFSPARCEGVNGSIEKSRSRIPAGITSGLKWKNAGQLDGIYLAEKWHRSLN